MDERRKASGAHEKGAAKQLGAKQHKGSGSGNRRQDMHTDEALIECKTVLEGKKQITIKASDLKQLSYFAATQDRDPVMHIRLDGRSWMLITEGDYVDTHQT